MGNLMRRLLSLMIGSLFIPVSVHCQNTAVTAEPWFLEEPAPKAIRLPVPRYPEAAKREGFSGELSVAVYLDANGKVQSATFVSGPGSVCPSVTNPNVLEVRRLAIQAAKSARFSPVTGGDPMRIRSGYIRYLFPRIERSGNDRGETKRFTAFGTRTGSGSGSGSGGILNDTATFVAKPVYPAAARAVRASGQVTIEVLVDEEGNILTAEAVAGHPLLRHAARTAACGTTFRPVLLEGNPVKVRGVINYNFVP